MARDIELLLSDVRGVNIPRDFAEQFGPAEAWGCDEGDFERLLEGPEVEGYWDTWHRVIEAAEYQGREPTYQGFTLHHDGDLFLVPPGFDLEGWAGA